MAKEQAEKEKEKQQVLFLAGKLAVTKNLESGATIAK